MRKQYRHIMLLCLFTRKTVVFYKCPLQRQKSTSKRNRQAVQKSGSNRILQRFTKGLWSKILFFEPCKKKLMIVISSY